MYKPLLISTLVATQSLASEEPSQGNHRAVDNLADDSFKVVAIPFYDPSVSAGISVVPIYAFYTDNQAVSASTISATLTYTENESYYLTGNTDLLLKNDKLRFVSEFGFRHTNFDFVDTIPVTEETISFDGDLYYQFFKDIYLGAGINYAATRYEGTRGEGKALLRALGFSPDFESDMGMRFSLLWDTREHYYLPKSGFAWQFSYEDHGTWLGNDKNATYASVYSDFRHFYSLDSASNHIIASKWVGRYLMDADQAPTSAFTTYGRQGRETQRGFEVGDYIASHMVNVELEYRYKLHDFDSAWLNKTSLVGLAGVGKVFGEQIYGPEQDFKDSTRLGMIGAGLRYSILPKQRINIRMDITYNSDDEVLAYFSLGESI